MRMRRAGVPTGLCLFEADPLRSLRILLPLQCRRGYRKRVSFTEDVREIQGDLLKGAIEAAVFRQYP